MSDELLPMVLEALGDDRVTTAEAAARLEHAFKYRCPDDLAKTLSMYRKEGFVKGKVSFDDGGWIWWADDECRAKAGIGNDSGIHRCRDKAVLDGPLLPGSICE